LRPGRTQVGRFRIEALAEKRFPPSVIGMARGARSEKCSMPARMFSVEGMMGLRSWRYADGTAILRAVVAANTSIGDGVASALKPRRTRINPYPEAATARANRISETTFQCIMSASPV